MRKLSKHIIAGASLSFCHCVWQLFKNLDI